MRPSLVMAALLLAAGPVSAQTATRLDDIKLPPGFKIQVFAQSRAARSIAVAPPLNAVFIGNRSRGTVSIAVDADKDGKADTVKIIAEKLYSPNGVAWRDGYLYVGEQTQVWRTPANDVNSIDLSKREMVIDGLPDKGHHGWRYLALDPKDRLYVAVGSPCNACEPQGIEGTIVRVESGKPVVVAKGIRNSVGIDFHPKSGVMYFTDNGVDLMGDNSPPDELNKLSREGEDFGFPSYGGGTDKTKEFGAKAKPDMTPPIGKFGAHVAALGLHFYRGSMFPQDYRTDAFVAQHGSWNRSQPDGYRVMRVKMDADGDVKGMEPFAEGWLQGGHAWGRPVDVSELPDGSLLVSDDTAGQVYRISYSK